MPNDERILETMPTGTLGLIPTASCMELGKKVDSYLSTWREHREHEHHNDIAFKEYHKESYIIEPHIPRFGSGEAKCVINQSVRGYDLYIMVDVTNYSMTYSLCGFKACHCCGRRKSPPYHCHSSIPVRKPSAQKNCP